MSEDKLSLDEIAEIIHEESLGNEYGFEVEYKKVEKTLLLQALKQGDKWQFLVPGWDMEGSYAGEEWTTKDDLLEIIQPYGECIIIRHKDDADFVEHEFVFQHGEHYILIDL